MNRIGIGVAAAAWLALAAGGAWGAPRLVWDPNPVEEGVTAYTVYWGPVSRHAPEFGGYPESRDTPATELALPPPDDLDTTYFAAVVARNALGLTSDYSVEVTISTGSSGGSGGGGGGCFVRFLVPVHAAP